MGSDLSRAAATLGGREPDEEGFDKEEKESEQDEPVPEGGALAAVADKVGHGFGGRGRKGIGGETGSVEELFDFVAAVGGEVGLVATIVEGKPFGRGWGEEEGAGLLDFAMGQHIPAGAGVAYVGYEGGGLVVVGRGGGEGARGFVVAGFGGERDGSRGREGVVGERMGRAEEGHVVEGGDEEGLMNEVGVLGGEGRGEEVETAFGVGGEGEGGMAVDKFDDGLGDGACIGAEGIEAGEGGRFEVFVTTLEDTLVEGMGEEYGAGADGTFLP